MCVGIGVEGRRRGRTPEGPEGKDFHVRFTRPSYSVGGDLRYRSLDSPLSCYDSCARPILLTARLACRIAWPGPPVMPAASGGE